MRRESLGKIVLPINYNLTIEPDFQTFTFKGKVLIKAKIAKPSRLIRLNVKELQVLSAVVNKLPAKTAIQGEMVTLTLPKSVKGTVLITIEYLGKHNEGMYGFYRSKHQEQYILTTQFEAANARAAFPCFDEPGLKATFDVTLIISPNRMALSNMPIKQQKALPGKRKQVIFHTSPVMSTYLLYLGVGNFKLISTKYNQIDLRIITVPEKIKYTALALQYTKTFLKFFEEYFQVPYPLPKLDMIAIPDFAAGAMENWGAITFREIALLGDETTSVMVKQNIAITVAHELAHQWFGNLVTMDWWEDLWLNESFATFMSYKAVHAAFPEWDLPLQYFEDTIADALSADELESTHPINVTVNTPGEIDEIFDKISYDKGGSILHMLEDHVGEEIFRKGLHLYLKKHAYKNATKEDLWKSIQQAYGKNTLIELMHRWIVQPGYPLIEIRKTTQGFPIEQRRFTLRTKKFPEQWSIPIRYATSSGIVKSVLLTSSNTILPDYSDWIKLNYGQHGFYRVKYDPYTLTRLGTAIRQKMIPTLDVAGIEDDLFSFTIAGHLSVEEYVHFIERYCLNAAYPLDASISGHLNALLRLFYGQRVYPTVHKTSLFFHVKVLQRLGWERKPDEKNTATMLRSMTLASLGLLGHPETLQQAQQRFEQIRRGHTPIDPNLRGVLYLLAAWQGQDQTFAYLLQRYQREQVPEESRKLLRALGMFQQKPLLQKALDLSQSSTVRLQDSLSIPLTVSGNHHGDSILWSWTRKNWSLFLKKYSPGTHMLSHLVHNLAFISTPELKQQVQEFFRKKENNRDDIKMAYKQLLERIDINISLMERNK